MEEYSSVTVVEALEKDLGDEKAINFVSKKAADQTFSQNFVAQGGAALLLKGRHRFTFPSFFFVFVFFFFFAFLLPSLICCRCRHRADGKPGARQHAASSDDFDGASVDAQDDNGRQKERRQLHVVFGAAQSHHERYGAHGVAGPARAVQADGIVFGGQGGTLEGVCICFSGEWEGQGKGIWGALIITVCSLSFSSLFSQYMSCLRPAFVGIALLDANIYGLKVASNMMQLEPQTVFELEEADVLSSIFPLCENEGLSVQVAEFQLNMCRAYQKRAATPVNMDDAAHMQLFEKLWSVTQKPFPGKSSPQWKTLGFQGDSPASDFRGMGLFGLEQLVYFVETCATEARMIFQVQNNADSEMYYPVATAGIIVSSLVLNAFETRSKSGQPTPVVLSEGINKLWVAVFRHVDTVFVERKLGYLQFGDLTKSVGVQVADALAQDPLTAAEVSAFLKAADESSPTIVGSGKKKPRAKVLSTNIIGGHLHRADNDKVPRLEFNNASQKPKHHQMRSEGKRLRKAAQVGDAKKIIEVLGRDKEGGYALVNDPEPDSRLTPLHLACLSGDADSVTLLCGAGAALECVAPTYGTPLHCACDKGNVTIVEALLEGGAKINSSTSHNARTPLMVAASRGHTSVVKALIKAGADLSTLDAEGNSAADYWHGDDNVLKVLGTRRKRVSLTMPASARNNDLSPRGGGTGTLEREILVLKSENQELRSLVADLSKRVEALEKKTPREKSKEKKPRDKFK